MRVRLGDLRRVIREGVLREGTDFVSLLDKILIDLNNVNKEVERAHGLAPRGEAKAIIAGVHSDLFNQASEMRRYFQRLRSMS